MPIKQYIPYHIHSFVELLPILRLVQAESVSLRPAESGSILHEVWNTCFPVKRSNNNVR